MNNAIEIRPWAQCFARAVFPEGKGRCDLTKGHSGPHAVERGMYWIEWSRETWTVSA